MLSYNSRKLEVYCMIYDYLFCGCSMPCDIHLNIHIMWQIELYTSKHCSNQQYCEALPQGLSYFFKVLMQETVCKRKGNILDFGFDEV